MDAWDTHLGLALDPMEMGGSNCWLWCELHRGILEMESHTDGSQFGFVSGETLECGGSSGAMQDSMP